MDTMRSLNTSLPHQPRRRPSKQTNEQLIQSFKNAALSVTNLYRTAEANDHSSKNSGYQDALDELLAFLDKENIGLCDGEGWRIRQWATERLDDQPRFQGGSDDEEEKVEAGSLSRRTPPINNQRPPGPMPDPANQNSPTPTVQHRVPASDHKPSATQDNSSQQAPSVFNFRAPYVLPQDSDMQPPDVATIGLPGPQLAGQTQPQPAITFNVLPRNSKGSRGGRLSPMPSTSRGLGSGAGSKRRIPFGDYFDLASLDGLGGNKRGKLC